MLFLTVSADHDYFSKFNKACWGGDTACRANMGIQIRQKRRQKVEGTN